MKNLPKHNKLSLGLISGLVEGQFVFLEKKISISNVVLFSMKQWQTQSILIQCKDSQFSSNQFFANKKKKRQIKWNLSFTFLCELYLISVRRHFYKCISTLAPTHFLLLLLLITFFVYYNVDIIIVMKEKKGKNWQKILLYKDIILDLANVLCKM